MNNITENRKDFIKNNNIIVKVNNYDDLCDVLSIFDKKALIDAPIIILMNITGYNFSKSYIVRTAKEIIITSKYKKYKESKMLIHEFPTKNFINAFNN